MVAKYYGREYSLETLRKTCHIASEGVSLLGISEAAESIGCKTLGGRFSFDTLAYEAQLPCIVHWNQDHFVVVYKIYKPRFQWLRFRSATGRKVCVADPGKGLITYTENEFKQHWISTRTQGDDKGIALLIEPTPKFFKQIGEKQKHNSIKFLLNYFLRYKRFLGQLIMGLMLASLFQLLFPFLTQSIVDIGIRNQNIGFIYLVLLAQMVLMLSRMSVDFIRRWILLHISTRINLSLVSDFFIKLMRLPMNFFDTKLMGDLLQRIDDHRRVEKFLTSQSLNVLFSVFNFVVFGIVLCIYSLKIFAIFLTGSIIYTLWILVFLKKRRQLDYKSFEQRSMNQSKTYQLITGMQEIKLQNCEQRKRWEWEDVQADLFRVNIASLKLEQVQEAGDVLINETKNILITIIAATSVIHGELTLGMMLAVQYIIGQLNSPIDQTINFIHDYQDTRISLERINEIHQKKDENANRNSEDFHFHSISTKDINITNLTFQYEGPHSPKALNGINLQIPEGKTTAIVGASGSGKTTLIKLLLQYYEPMEGNILVGDQNLGNFNTKWWRNQCGAVMQDGYLFSESIARNIAVSDDEIDTERLLFAAKTANIHDFIKSLPLKYNTKIGQEGQGISQGQRQRILIARAVYRNPHFIFLDEATNALDAKNERQIIENLEEFYRGKTVVVVAHRLSTVKNADQIAVLENGRLVEKGTHRELTAKKGYYYQLVKNQLELGN
jgi:ATP-binding cassette subfamily B protein